MRLRAPVAWRRVGWALVGVAVVTGLMWVRALAEARYALARAEQAERAQQAERALEARVRAVRWSALLNPYAQTALEQLLQQADALERAQHHGQALRVYRRIHGGLRSSAAPGQSHAEALAQVDQHIASLSARVRPTSPQLSDQAEHASVRRGSGQAFAGGRLLALLGFVLWVLSGFGLAQLGFRRDGTYKRGPVLALGALVSAGFGVFCLGLWLA